MTLLATSQDIRSDVEHRIAKQTLNNKLNALQHHVVVRL